MLLRKLQSTLLNTMSASMNPSSSPTVYTSNYPTISPPSYSPSSSITNYHVPSYSPSSSITYYPIPSYSPSSSITNYPTVATPSYSPSQSIFSLNPSVYNTPTPTVYSLSTPIYHQSNINDDDITIQKKYVGLYIGLTLFVIFGLLFYINLLYRKNKKLNKYIEYKKEYVQQPIGRVKVRNIFTSI
jgi:hypothetical protein